MPKLEACKVITSTLYDSSPKKFIKVFTLSMQEPIMMSYPGFHN